MLFWRNNTYLVFQQTWQAVRVAWSNLEYIYYETEYPTLVTKNARMLVLMRTMPRETRLVTWSTTVTTDVRYIDVFLTIKIHQLFLLTIGINASPDSFPWTLSVPWNSQFSSSCALEELFASRNSLCPRKIFALHWGYCLYRQAHVILIVRQCTTISE